MFFESICGVSKTTDPVYYKKSGQLHTSEIGEFVRNFQWWEIKDNKIIGDHDTTTLGQIWCDQNGVSRKGSWIKIGELSSKYPELYDDVEFYLLKY